MDDFLVGLLNCLISVLFFFQVELVPLGDFDGLLEGVGIVFGAMLESDFHVIHPPIEIGDLSNLFLLPLEVQEFDLLLTFGRLGLYLSA